MATIIPPLEPLESHAHEATSGAVGRTLVLWGRGLDRQLPDAVSSIDHHESGVHLEGLYDSVVSVGQLGTAVALESLLLGLVSHLQPHAMLHFCEPTIASDVPTAHPPHDVTRALWASGFSVIQCRRFRARHRLRTHHYCWGRARA